MADDLHDDLFDTALGDFLRLAASTLDPFAPDDEKTTGPTVDFQTTRQCQVAMHKFCWCDLDDCAWCAGHDEEVDDASQIEREARKAAWDALGFVEGQGAPNFLFRSGDFVVRVWWYKHMRRSLETDMTADQLPVLAQRFTAWASLARASIAQASLAKWLTAEDTGLDEVSARIMREGFLARLVECQDRDCPNKASPDDVISDISHALAALRQQAWKAKQLSHIENSLNEAGIAVDDPEFPSELFGPMTPAYRAERALLHGGAFPRSQYEDVTPCRKGSIQDPANEFAPF